MHQQSLVLAPSATAVSVERDIPVGDLQLDLYRSMSDRTEKRPVVVIVSGYPDSGFARHVGVSFRAMKSVVDWAHLFAQRGTVAATYSSDAPLLALSQLFAAIRSNSDEWRLDGERVALFACSGNVPTALAALGRAASARPRCAALAYGYMLDGDNAVTDAAQQFRFAYAPRLCTFDDLLDDVPLLIARAGRDEMPRLNETIDRFVGEALARNAPMTLINHAAGRHAFDIHDDTPQSRAVIRSIVDFIHANV